MKPTAAVSSPSRFNFEHILMSGSVYSQRWRSLQCTSIILSNCLKPLGKLSAGCQPG